MSPATLAVSTITAMPASQRRRAARTRDLIEFARTHGFRREELIQMIESLP